MFIRKDSRSGHYLAIQIVNKSQELGDIFSYWGKTTLAISSSSSEGK